MTSVNGNPVLAGVLAGDQDLPVVGPRRCRVTRPLLAPATHRGRWGTAWRVDLAAIRSRLTVFRNPDAMVCHWVVEAPWSSEVVHSYSLVLVSLAWRLGVRAAERYVEGATHELVLWAIHPMAERAEMLTRPTNVKVWLQPPVFGAQVVAASDEAAEKRLFGAVELICDGRLSPHAAHVRSWAALFGDEMLRRATAPAAGEGENKS